MHAYMQLHDQPRKIVNRAARPVQGPSISIYLSLSICVYIYIYMCVYTYISIYLHVYATAEPAGLPEQGLAADCAVT